MRALVLVALLSIPAQAAAQALDFSDRQALNLQRVCIPVAGTPEVLDCDTTTEATSVDLVAKYGTRVRYYMTCTEAVWMRFGKTSPTAPTSSNSAYWPRDVPFAFGGVTGHVHYVAVLNESIDGVCTVLACQ